MLASSFSVPLQWFAHWSCGLPLLEPESHSGDPQCALTFKYVDIHYSVLKAIAALEILGFSSWSFAQFPLKHDPHKRHKELCCTRNSQGKEMCSARRASCSCILPLVRNRRASSKEIAPLCKSSSSGARSRSHFNPSLHNWAHQNERANKTNP